MNKENKEELKKKIKEIVSILNDDEKWVKRYGDKPYWDVFLEVFQFQKEEIIKMIEIKDAYKIPFSKAEIDYELLPENRAKKEIVNEYYKKGRDDEFFDLLFKIKQL